MNGTPLWASESFWKKTAIWVTAGSFIILVVLTLINLMAEVAWQGINTAVRD
jgi:nitric oxide reductase subunit C